MTSILQEAEHLVNGPRQEKYGHPLDNFTMLANVVSAMLAHKLKEPLTAEDCVLIMEQVKIAREINEPGRDNRTDGAGYWKVLDMVHEERSKRAQQAASSLPCSQM